MLFQCLTLLPEILSFTISLRKKQLESESEIQSLRKANLNLENLLEATKACKRQEVSQLNKIHAETLKVGSVWLACLSVLVMESLHGLLSDTSGIPDRLGTRVLEPNSHLPWTLGFVSP